MTRHHGGAGLGLFVAGQILAAHGTKIEVASELGKGAVFSFRLPTYQGEQLSPTALESEAATASALE